MHSIIQKALQFPAAVLLGSDLLARFDAVIPVNYDVGVQQPKQHKRFANFFQYDNKLMMYFKHEQAEIAEVYRRAPGVVVPSEIATKYWSKILVLEAEDLAAQLLETSYRLICDSLTRRGRQMIENSAAYPNRFPDFHKAAVLSSKSDGVSLRYRVYDEPSILLGIEPVAQFSWNWLHIRQSRSSTESVSEADTKKRTELGPERHLEWPEAIRLAITDTDRDMSQL